MNPNMSARIKICFKLVPQFRRLVLKIPLEIAIARRKISLFSSRPLLIPAYPDNYRLIILLFDDLLKRILFQNPTALDPRKRAIGESLAGSQRRFVLADHEINVPLSDFLIPKLDHFRDLIARIDVDTRHRHVTKKRFASEP